MKVTQELEDALRNYKLAEQYFENAYIAYRLAKKYLDEMEATVETLRQKVDLEVEQRRAAIND